MFKGLMSWVVIGLLIIIAALALALKVQTTKLATETANVKAAEARLETCATANDTQAAAIAELRAANSANSEDLAAAKLAANVMTVAVADWRESALAASAREEHLRRTIYVDDPDCARWGAQPVCAGIADRL